MKILSWNVNGIRAAHKKGFADWLTSENADIVCVQETKAYLEQFPQDIRYIKGYDLYASSAEKKGYSGVAIWAKDKPKALNTSLSCKRFDEEGRVIHLEFKEFDLFNIYFPNGGASNERLRFKLDFYDTVLRILIKLKNKKKHMIVCGDVNTAHKEIDLARPAENQDSSGFLLIEREWIDNLLSNGFVDTFRIFNQKGENYSWWDYKTSARDRNVGWRIDYFFVNESLKKKVKKAFIQKDVLGSDHCPVGIEIKF
ncbi:MAG: exodeoxyribonuclease III [Dehalococcoidia bacterium]|nr:MAG: exodeoxyribonuclease III [Dehalococcoidia bacterium]